MPAKCGWSALKARLARELLPWKGWRISEGNSSRPCVCASRNNFAAGKGVESDVRQVQVCLACFSWATCRFFLQAVASKTAQVSRAEKKRPAFPNASRSTKYIR